jgi:hypothetical protein
MANEAIPKNPMLVETPEQEVDNRPRKSEEEDIQFKDPSKMSLKELMESAGDDVAYERAKKKDAVGNMSGAQEGSSIEREDAPHYLPMGQAWHKNLYEQWRTSPNSPKGVPGWDELGKQGRGLWMNSSVGRAVLTPAKQKFKSENFSERLGKPVAPSSSATAAPKQPEYDAAKRERQSVIQAGAAASNTVIDPNKMGSPDSKIAFGDNYEHHKALSSLVDRIASKHNGSSSAVPGLEQSARKAISDSLVAQAGGKPREAVAHFTNAVSHTMALATAVKGASHNAGEASNAGVAPEHMEASDHLNNYTEYVSGIKGLGKGVRK